MVRRESAAQAQAIRETKTDRVIEWGSNIMIGVLAFLCLYPYLNVVAKSFSSADAVLRGQVNGIWPIGFTVESYKLVLYSTRFLSAFQTTVFLTVAGTVLNVTLTMFVAFGVSRKDLPGGKLIMILYIITMLFGGGLIPTYLVVIGSGLRNSIWALIIPGLVTPYNLVLMRNYFDALPDSLEESATIDGASQFCVLFEILMPLAMPSIATIALFCAVGYWNVYFSALIYIDDRSRATLQIYLREIMLSIQDAERSGIIDEVHGSMPSESMRGAAVLASTLPIILVYPFLQKYYVKGMTLGAVKG